MSGSYREEDPKRAIFDEVQESIEDAIYIQAEKHDTPVKYVLIVSYPNKTAESDDMISSELYTDLPTEALLEVVQSITTVLADKVAMNNLTKGKLLN